MNASEELRDELYQRFSPLGRLRLRLRRAVRIAAWWLIVLPLAAAKRIVDVLGALLLLLLSSPLFVLYWLSARSLAFARIERTGRYGVVFAELRFPPPRGMISRAMHATALVRLPILLNILRGDLSFIGPRLLNAGELSARDYAVRKRLNVRPGLVCLWWIRRRANIAYSDELQDDAEYVDTHTLKSDIGIALRAIPAMLYGEGVAAAPDEITLLDIRVDNMTMQEAIDAMLARMQARQPAQVCFVNADCANCAFRNPTYHGMLRRASLVFADGIGMKLAGKLLRSEIKQNVNGTDMFPRLCAALEQQGRRLFLLGAKPGITERVRAWIAAAYPRLIVCGTQHGYFTPDEEPAMLARIAAAKPDLLLVAFGAPRQDLWVAQHQAATGATVAMGVGGLFDFYSGVMPRAPQWMREIGMEWLFRFIQEPRRMWNRYFVGNAVFLGRVVRMRRRIPRATMTPLTSAPGEPAP